LPSYIPETSPWWYSRQGIRQVPDHAERIWDSQSEEDQDFLRWREDHLASILLSISRQAFQVAKNGRWDRFPGDQFRSQGLSYRGYIHSTTPVLQLHGSSPIHNGDYMPKITIQISKNSADKLKRLEDHYKEQNGFTKQQSRTFLLEEWIELEFDGAIHNHWI